MKSVAYSSIRNDSHDRHCAQCPLSVPTIDELYRSKGAQVYRRCFVILRDKQEAEDMRQEVFARLIKYGGCFEDQKVPMAWLYRTAERLCFTRITHQKRDIQLTDWYKDWKKREVIQNEGATDILKNCFYLLNPELRHVAYMYYVDGMSQELIAKKLSKSRRTIVKKMKQIKTRLVGMRLEYMEALV